MDEGVVRANANRKSASTKVHGGHFSDRSTCLAGQCLDKNQFNNINHTLLLLPSSLKNL